MRLAHGWLCRIESRDRPSGVEAGFPDGATVSRPLSSLLADLSGMAFWLGAF